VTPGRDSYPADASVVRVVRVRTKRVTTSVRLAYSVVRRADASLYRGQERVVRAGRSGLRRVAYADLYLDGTRKRHHRVGSELVRRPRARVVHYGTAVRPRPKPAPAPAPAPAPTGGGSGAGYGSTGAEGLNWGALAACESGGNPRAVNAAGYYGLYQFSLSTWAAVGGSGNPIDASASEQTYRAQILYTRAGVGQWPVCGPRLYS